MESFANKSSNFGDLTNLSIEKLQELDTVLTTIVALPIAQNIYAQIIDGYPTHPKNKAPQPKTENTSSLSGKAQPTDRAIQEYEKIRKTFATQDLHIDLKLAQDYQNAQSGSRENRLRLLQMIAASVNALARRICLDFHPDINTKPAEPREGYNARFNGCGKFYVTFYHASYTDAKRYPFGLADITGYWAETELFGGVMLFEREESGHKIINAFLHPRRSSSAFQLSENQILDLAGFKEGAETVLPLTQEADARTEPTVVRKGKAPLRIYKNEYDKPPEFDWPEPNCVVMPGDPRAASFDRAMKFIVEKGWDKGPGSGPPPGQPLPTAWSALEDSTTSKGGPKPGEKKDEKKDE